MLLRTYYFYEKFSTVHNHRCIDNSITGSNKCVGYCQYNEHPGFLTEELLQQHDCLGKGCYHFIPKPRKEKPTKTIDLSSNIYEHAKKAFSSIEGIMIIGVKNTEYNKYDISYITITNEYNLEDYIAIATKLFDVDINFIRLNYSFEKCVNLICNN